MKKNDNSEAETGVLEIDLPEIDSLASLNQLETGTRIEVTRASPITLKGYLGEIPLTDGGITDLQSEMKATWGGGTYTLKAKTRSGNGRLNFIKGSARIDISGNPKEGGREFVNGTWRDIAYESTPTRSQFPAIPQIPSSGGDPAKTTVEMLQALLPMLQGSSGGNLDLAGVITALGSITSRGGDVGQSAPRDVFSDAERMLGLISAIRDSGGGGGVAQADPEPMSFESMMPMMMMKMMMGQQQPPPPPQWGQAYHPGYMSQQQPPPQPARGPDPRSQEWQEFQEFKRWKQGAESATFHQSSPDPRGSSQKVASDFHRSEQKNSSELNSEPSDVHDEVELTPDFLVEELGAMEEGERAQFISEVLQKMGVEDQIMQKFAPESAGGFQLNLPDN